jgi:ABC-type microcin C transport system permease subunit YejE
MDEFPVVCLILGAIIGISTGAIIGTLRDNRLRLVIRVASVVATIFIMMMFAQVVEPV